MKPSRRHEESCPKSDCRRRTTAQRFILCHHAARSKESSRNPRHAINKTDAERPSESQSPVAGSYAKPSPPRVDIRRRQPHHPSRHRTRRESPANFPPSKRPQSHSRPLLQKASPVQFCNTHKRTGEPGTPLQVLPRPACCGVRSVFQRRVNGRGQRVANSCLLTDYGPHRMPLVAGPCKALLCFGPVQSRSGTTDSRMLGWLWQPF